MADGACSNCSKEDCPFMAEDHYDCYVRRMKEVKDSLSSDDVRKLEVAQAILKRSANETEETREASRALDELIRVWSDKLPPNSQ